MLLHLVARTRCCHLQSLSNLVASTRSQTKSSVSLYRVSINFRTRSTKACITLRLATSRSCMMTTCSTRSTFSASRKKTRSKMFALTSSPPAARHRPNRVIQQYADLTLRSKFQSVVQLRIHTQNRRAEVVQDMGQIKNE